MVLFTKYEEYYPSIRFFFSMSIDDVDDVDDIDTVSECVVVVSLSWQ